MRRLLMRKLIKRSLLFTLKFANSSKLKFLDELHQEYFKAIKYFIDVGVEEERIPDYEDVKKYPHRTFLSRRYFSSLTLSIKKWRKLRYWLKTEINRAIKNLRRIKQVCEARGVLWFTVSANYTSRACPHCG